MEALGIPGTHGEVLCVIGARGGSRSLVRKNLRHLGGIALAAHTFRQAMRIFDNVVLSTDDDEIADLGRSEGLRVPFRRPASLASDAAAKVPVIRHAALEIERLDSHQFPIVVDLQVTTPLRSDEDVVGALEYFVALGDAENVITVTPSASNPYFNQVELDDGRMRLIASKTTVPLRRQDAPEVYSINGAAYIWSRQALLEDDRVVRPNSYAFVMPNRRSIDIDSEFDLALAEFLLARETA